MHVKQYNIATLQSRQMLISTRAEGLLQITNQRVNFRATGGSFRGKNILQHEFGLDQIAGLEARKDYQFNWGSILFGALATLVVTGIFGTVSSMVYQNNTHLGLIFALLIGIGGLVPFFGMHEKFFMKLLCCGASLGGLLGA